MNNANPAAKPQDYPSIKAFLEDHLHGLPTVRMMTSDGYPQTVNGVNAVMAMANTRGTANTIREVLCGGKALKRKSLRPHYGYVAVHVESECTPTHASLTFLCMDVRRNSDGKVSERSLPQHAFPMR